MVFVLALVLLGVVGAGVVVSTMGKAAPAVLLGLWTIVGIPMVLMTHGECAKARQGELPRTFAETRLNESPSKGTVTSQSVLVSGGIRYLMKVEGQRPDLSLGALPALGRIESVPGEKRTILDATKSKHNHQELEKALFDLKLFGTP